MFFKKKYFLFFLFSIFKIKNENKDFIDNKNIEIIEKIENLEIKQDEDLKEQFLKPVVFTKNGIEYFLKEIYNNFEYRNFLSSCFIHIIDFLENSENTSNPKIFIQKSLNIFIQKIHQTSFINPYSFLYFLQQSNQYILNVINSEKIKIESEIEKIVEDFLLYEFETLKENPKDFIKKISKKILNSTEKIIIDCTETQKVFCDLIEISASKLIFDTNDFYESWSCFKSLCATISYLYDIGLICNEEVFQRILWAISSNFLNSCELQSENLDKEIKFFLENEINSNLPLIFYKEEIEKNILSKRDFLLKAKWL